MADTNEDEQKAAERAARKEKWDREQAKRDELFEIQYQEAIALHADFGMRRHRELEKHEAYVADVRSHVAWRANNTDYQQEVLKLLDAEVAALQRIAAALEAKRG